MVRAGDRIYAISAAMVENVLRLKPTCSPATYRRVIDQDRLSVPLPARLLAGQVGATEIQPYNSVLLLRSGVQRIAPARRRADRQPGNRREDDRPAARARAGRVGRDGARRRPHRPDRQPGAAGAATRARARPKPSECAPVVAARWRSREGRGADCHGRGRFAHRAQDHEPAARARGLPGPHRQGRRRRAPAAQGPRCRTSCCRHRDAAHGRLRPDQERAPIRAPPASRLS